MSQQCTDIAYANTQTKLITKQRNWPGIIIALVVGGTAAVIAVSTIAALMSIGAAGFIAGISTIGILGSVLTIVTGNAVDASSVRVTIH